MRNKELIVAVVISTLFLGLGIYKVTDKTKETPTSVVKEQKNPKLIQYEGREGKSVFELLKAGNQVVASESSLGVFVSEINGIKNTENEFWLFYVNDKLAEVSADTYITKDGDKIEWRFEESPF
ncbi:MAG: DUF4430 domain-containing protein [Candidatus Aenigmarchaeota archaeon]|nr:DUF4430 domain-containing protein [Candidatus Aenigmarchaeota archaeon]